MEIATNTCPLPGWRQKRLEHEWRFAALRVRIAASRLLKAFDPNQPRVSAGNPDGGQWTDSGASHERPARADKPVLLAQAGPQRPSNRIIVDGQLLEATPGQVARYEALHAQAASALRQVRTIDPNWRPAPSLTSGGVEGEIAKREGELRETEAHLKRIIPLDFNYYNHYASFGGALYTATRRAGYNDTELYMRGSSVTGQSFSKGTPFRPASDYDVAIVSPTMMRRAEAIGVELHRSRGRTKKLNPRQERRLGLKEIADELSREFGHPTNFMIYRSRQDIEIRDQPERNAMRSRYGNIFADDYVSYRRIPIGEE